MCLLPPALLAPGTQCRMTGKFHKQNFKSPLLHLRMENFNCTFLQPIFYNLQIFRVGRFYKENFIEKILNLKIFEEENLTQNILKTASW